MQSALALNRPWAVSDGNAGAFHTTFDSTLQAINNLDWNSIEARSWAECIHQKQAEFLVADFFPWTAFHEIGCYDAAAVAAVETSIAHQNHRPKVSVERAWYY